MTSSRKKRALAALLVATACGALAFLWLGRGAAPRAGSGQAVPAIAATVMGWPVAISDAAGGFSDPFGLVVDRSGNLYVADAGEHNQIRKVGVDGAVSVLAGGHEGFADGSGPAAAFHTPSGMAQDSAGNLIVADTGNNAIRRISPQGVVTTLAGTGAAGYRDGPAGQAQFDGPVGVALDQAGNVYVADTYNDRIRKIAVDGSVSTLAGGPAPGFADGAAALATFDTPCALVADASGNLFIADTGNGAIRRLGVDGQVSTLARFEPAGEDPPLPHPLALRRPLSLALAADGVLYIGDMGRGRIFQLAPNGEPSGLTGIGFDIALGDANAVRLGRPAGLALDAKGALLVADATARLVRRLTPRVAGAAAVPSRVAPAPASAVMASFPWPFAPQNARHEVVGILGEVRGSYDGESRDHFHNGLDIQANMGVPVLAVADEKVSSPVASGGFDELGEGLSVDQFAYVHMRVGRTIKNVVLDPARFALLTDDKGVPNRVRVRRGTRFHVGEPLGTVNRMFHVHLIQRGARGELNPMALPFPGMLDTLAPHIAGIELQDQATQKRLIAKRGKRLLVPRNGESLAIVVDAYDQTDGNAARRRLGLYKLGYQILGADGRALPGYEQALMNIEFNQLPPDQESVKLAYADKSGITVYGNKTTRFLYVVTNSVRDGRAAVGGWNPAALAAGDYVIRIAAFDYAGNQALGGRDLPVTIE